MKHYAADENYFTEEGLREGHESLVDKLEEKQRQHAEAERRRAAEHRAEQRKEKRRRSRRLRMVVITTVVTLLGVAGGWALSLLVL